VLCDLEGRPQREVAKHLNVAPATLATRLSSARRTLAQRLTRRGVTLSGGALAGLLGIHAAASAVPPALAAGVVRAVEAAAAGTAVNSLVSANALQLSEGVMRMMMLAKLKAVAVLAVTALALTTGLGLVPAAAGDNPVTGAAPTKAEGAPAKPTGPIDTHSARLKDDGRPDPNADDTTFLRRLCLHVRGTPPTDVETWFFVSDADDDKRAKLVDWMTADDAAKLTLAKKLGVPPERVKVVRARLSADGKHVELSVEDTGARFVQSLDLTAHDKTLVAGTPATLTRPTYIAQTINATEVMTAKTVTARKYDRWVAVDTLLLGEKIQHVPAQQFRVWDVADKTVTDRFVVNELYVAFDADADTDAEFLKRVLTDVRGNGPTALELKYFTEDKDPKKREKLVETLLKDPVVQKKLGDEWKQKMLAAKPPTFRQTELRADLAGDYRFLYVLPDGKPQPIVFPPQPPAAPQPDKFEKLVGELIAAKKSDEAILEAITLATLSRLPTDSEKKLALASVGKAADRKAAWVAVAKALAGTEAKKPETLKLRFHVDPPAPPTPPVPPAKP
jgi:hypothetical protein